MMKVFIKLKKVGGMDEILLQENCLQQNNRNAVLNNCRAVVGCITLGKCLAPSGSQSPVKTVLLDKPLRRK